MGLPYRTCLILSYPSLTWPGLQASADRRKDGFYFLGQMKERRESRLLSWDIWLENRTISSFQSCWVSVARAFVTFCLNYCISLTLFPIVCSFSSRQKDFTFLSSSYLFSSSTLPSPPSSISWASLIVIILPCSATFCLHPCHSHFGYPYVWILLILQSPS